MNAKDVYEWLYRLSSNVPEDIFKFDAGWLQMLRMDLKFDAGWIWLLIQAEYEC